MRTSACSRHSSAALGPPGGEAGGGSRGKPRRTRRASTASPREGAASLRRSRSASSGSHTSRPQTAGSFSPSRNRSEEHTSELQSPYDLVCRLLLEKKKKKKRENTEK